MGRPTVTVRGAGGWVFVMDVPDPGTHAEEIFRSQLAKGELAVVDDQPPAVTPRARPRKSAEESR